MKITKTTHFWTSNTHIICSVDEDYKGTTVYFHYEEIAEITDDVIDIITDMVMKNNDTEDLADQICISALLKAAIENETCLEKDEYELNIRIS